MWKSGERAAALFDKVRKMPSNEVKTTSEIEPQELVDIRSSSTARACYTEIRHETEKDTALSRDSSPLRLIVHRPTTSRVLDSSVTSVAAKLNPGDFCFVIRPDHSRVSAEIVEVRPPPAPLEYYVHYEGLNRRLDEWVAADRIDHSYQSSENNCKTGFNADKDDEGRKLTRHQKRKHEEVTSLAKQKLVDGEYVTTAALSTVSELSLELEREHESLTRVKYIEIIQLGKWEINTWYYSPYPEEYGKLARLFVCEFCLKYQKSEQTYRYHLGTCDFRSPPGVEIYAKDNISVFEVDGREHKLYCQNLCLLAKLFLDHKTLYYDVAPFMFYVLSERNKNATGDPSYSPVGYFSKERESAEHNNLACIMILPPYQRCGYGKFLISLSYELSKLEKLVGSPEKPLSDLGSVSYLSYWTYILINRLRAAGNNSFISLNTLSERTGIAAVDIVETFDMLGLVKYWRDGRVVRVSHKLLDDIVQNSPYYTTPRLLVDRKLLKWTPMPRSLAQTGLTNQSNTGKPSDMRATSHLIPNAQIIHFNATKGKKLRKI